MMTNQVTPINRVRPGLFFSLLIILLSVYLSTYSGFIESRDSIRVIDATSSLVHFGDLLRDESAWQDDTGNINPEQTYPFASYEPNEPLFPYFAALTYSLADLIPQLGYVHATWLLNIIVVALTGGVFFLIARQLDYSSHTAFTAALLLGTGTILWLYSKTMFREPLVMLLLVLIALSLYRWRRKPLQITWLAVAILGIVTAFYVKNSALFALPGLLILLLGDWQPPRLLRRLLDSLFVLGLLIVVAITLSQPALEIFLLTIPSSIVPETTYIRTALHSYLFSIGGSLWGTSPILLLAVPGSILLIRQGKRSLVWATVTIIIGYAVAHSLFTGQHWFGGTSYPPRFLVPVIPFAMLLTLPIFEYMLRPNSKLWLKIGVGFLALFSICLQIIASISLVSAYPSLLPPQANGLIEWLPGLNDVRYLRWLLLPQSWASLGYDIAWSRTGLPWIASLYGLVALLMGIALILWQKRLWIVNSLLSTVLLLVTAFGFQQLYQRDALYWAQTPALFDVLAILEENASPDETLLLAGAADVTYERFIMNYYHLRTARPVVLGFQPGERASEATQARVTSPLTANLLHPDTLRVIDHILNRQNRVWWLAHNSVFTPWAVRPEERYLTENYYLLNSYETGDPTVRLLEFSTVRAPSRDAFRLPEIPSSAQFGDYISLTGYTLPLGTSYTAGEVIPMTFFWQTDTVLSTDYTVALFLMHEETGFFLVTSLDSQPDAGFSPTPTWQPFRPIYDNRAIALPPDTPAGTYEIWVRLYTTGSGGIDQLPVTGVETWEDTTAVLSQRIEISATQND